MAINPSGLQTYLGGFQDGQAFTQSTATAEQEVLPHSGVAYVGVGTATGFARNRYFLASTTGTATDDELPDGLELWIGSTATGEAKVDVHGGTATGGYTFAAAGDFVNLKRWGGIWYLALNHGATIATATNS